MQIDDIAFGGEGVGRVDGFVVFVPLVIEGETVEATITEVKKTLPGPSWKKSSPQRTHASSRNVNTSGTAAAANIST